MHKILFIIGLVSHALVLQAQNFTNISDTIHPIFNVSEKTGITAKQSLGYTVMDDTIVFPFVEMKKLKLFSSSISLYDSTIYNRKLFAVYKVLGQIDSKKYYKGYKEASTGTFVVSLLVPPIGLVPAILCSKTPPAIESLNYPNKQLFSNQAYNLGYQQQAKKIKSKKVWGNFRIGVTITTSVFLLYYFVGSIDLKMGRVLNF